MRRIVRAFCSALTVMLALYSIQALAGARHDEHSFNHRTTGFPLTGAHATAECESCHVKGVFKGTPRTCDACHTTGKRIVAMAKPSNHIVTEAPCDTCHFSTATFLGAHFNHGTAVPGQCTTCHNGTITTGRPSSHNMGLKATGSCDNCHRSYAWQPTGFNHVGVIPGSCDNSGCHVAGANQFFRSPTTHARAGMATYKCDECHNTTTWYNAQFNHLRPSPQGRCNGCHNGSIAIGTPAGHVDITATPDCITCHTSTISWLNALLGAKPANHIPYTAAAQCSNCHASGGTVATGSALHAFVAPPCTTCHLAPQVYLSSVIQTMPSSHLNGSPDCISCHTTQYTQWNSPMGSKPANHIPYIASAQCSNCHTGTTVATGSALHAFVSPPCMTCHLAPQVYLSATIQTRPLSHMNGKPDCISCHQTQYMQWNEP